MVELSKNSFLLIKYYTPHTYMLLNPWKLSLHCNLHFHFLHQVEYEITKIMFPVVEKRI